MDPELLAEIDAGTGGRLRVYEARNHLIAKAGGLDLLSRRLQHRIWVAVSVVVFLYVALAGSLARRSL